MQQNNKVRGLFQPILGTLFDACNIAAKVTSHFGRLEQVWAHTMTLGYFLVYG